MGDLLVRAPAVYQSPIIKILNDSEFELVEPFVYQWVDWTHSDRINNIYQITIPRGFVTDGASVPRFCWSLTGLIPTGVHMGAAVVHDYLYQRRGVLDSGELMVSPAEGIWQTDWTVWNRPECDEMFRHIMSEAQETPWKREVMFWAVRIFGEKAWGN